MRQASIRNQRNKGLRLNNFLQICISTLVFFWLLYQLKQSFDKKKEPDEHRSRSLNNAIDSHSEFVVLGRKALPHDQDIVSEGKVSNDDKENEEEEEEEEEEVEKGMDDEEVKEIAEAGIDELDNEQEDEQDDQERGYEEAEEEAEFLDDQDPEEAHEKGYENEDEFTSLHQDPSNGIGDRNNRVDEEQPEKRKKGVEAEGKTGRSRKAGDNSTIEGSPIDHSKQEGNLLTAGVLDIQAKYRRPNETLGKNDLLPLDDEALIESLGNTQKMNPL